MEQAKSLVQSPISLNDLIAARNYNRLMKQMQRQPISSMIRHAYPELSESACGVFAGQEIMKDALMGKARQDESSFLKASQDIEPIVITCNEDGTYDVLRPIDGVVQSETFDPRADFPTP